MISENELLLCPHCGSDFMHPESAYIFGDNDSCSANKFIKVVPDELNTINSYEIHHINASRSFSRRVRELSVAVEYKCENCQRMFTYAMLFHKGTVCFKLENFDTIV